MHPWRAWNPGALKSTSSEKIIPSYIEAGVTFDTCRYREPTKGWGGAGYGRRGGYLK